MYLTTCCPWCRRVLLLIIIHLWCNHVPGALRLYPLPLTSHNSTVQTGLWGLPFEVMQMLRHGEISEWNECNARELGFLHHLLTIVLHFSDALIL